MIFNAESLTYKAKYLDSILANRELLETVIRRHIKVDWQLTNLPRVWEPGGGATLFKLEYGSEKILIKVKSKYVWVESKLECEPEFAKTPSLENEYNFLCHLKQLKFDNMPTPVFWEDTGDHQFLALEWLESFWSVVENATLDDMLSIWENIWDSVSSLYDHGITHTDIHEYNICFRGKQPILIDFEEAKFLAQDVPFEKSIDVTGNNKYGDVGNMPLSNDAYSLPGKTCLARLRNLFQKIIAKKLPPFIEDCNFDHNCVHNLDTLQEPDERIYQSINHNGLKIIGQRPIKDKRTTLVKIISKEIKNTSPLTHLDIGCNLGNFCFALAKSPSIAKSIGIDASNKYITACQGIKFISNNNKVEFADIACGDKPISTIARKVDYVTVFSVYHHIKNKDSFLDDLHKLNPKLILAEFATQDRFYPERGTLENEIQYLTKQLGYKIAECITTSNDYQRPIYYFSNKPISSFMKFYIELRFNGFSPIRRNPIIKFVRKLLRYSRRKLKWLIDRKAVGSNNKIGTNTFIASLRWVEKNTIPHKGIKVSNVSSKPYPEVTGYYIPTLLNWGQKEKALGYAKWLTSIQNSDGSWTDPEGEVPYTFDTGQIIKGLIAALPFLPELRQPIITGCNWILEQIESNGRITTPEKKHWKLPNGQYVSENIHLYALEPLREASKLFNKPQYEEAVQRALNYYLATPNLVDFNTLSHFHAYVIEALVDLGCMDVATKGMEQISRLQKRNGSIPAYQDVNWICSTAVAQYAVIWYKLGNIEAANKSLNYLSTIQNPSGGFYGSYGRKSNYFPNQEISWATKYYLDAYSWHIRTQFDSEVSLFPSSIEINDGRVKILAENSIFQDPSNIKILDAGCGKGRFCSALKELFPEAEFWGCDLSDKMLVQTPEFVNTKQGSLLNLPFPENYFDLVFSVEALEHSFFPDVAVKELCRVAKTGGQITIIDKNIEHKGSLSIAPWEKWFSRTDIEQMLQTECLQVTSKYITYENSATPDGLFIAWNGIKSTQGKYNVKNT